MLFFFHDTIFYRERNESRPASAWDSLRIATIPTLGDSRAGTDKSINEIAYEMPFVLFTLTKLTICSRAYEEIEYARLPRRVSQRMIPESIDAIAVTGRRWQILIYQEAELANAHVRKHTYIYIWQHRAAQWCIVRASVGFNHGCARLCQFP